MNGARRPLAVAIVLCFYASLFAVSVGKAFDQGAGRGRVVAGGIASAPAVGVSTFDDGPGAAATPGSVELGATGASSGDTATPGTSRPSGGGPASRGTTATVVTTPTGAQVPDGPLRLGVRVVSQESMTAMAAVLGTRGISSGDPRGYAESLIKAINANGGIAGRQVEADILEIDVARLVANPDASDQADCEHFTDAKVFAVVTPAPSGSPLAPCLASRGMPLILSSPEEFNAQDLGELGGMFSMPSIINLHRQAPVIIDALLQQGFYDGAKVGFLWYDKPTFREAVEESWLPTFADRGIELTDEVAMSSYTNSEQFSSAVLRFKSRGVDHVQFVDVSGLVALQFMQYAESQQYYPTYGLSSASSLSAIQTGVSPSQLDGAIGVGWMPSLDVSDHPGFSSTAQSCLDVLREDGRSTGDQVAVAIAMWTCEVITFFQAVMERAPEHTPAGYVAGLHAIGSGYVPADTFATTIGPGRYDGPAAVRNVGYDNSCSCFVYTSDVYSIG